MYVQHLHQMMIEVYKFYKKNGPVYMESLFNNLRSISFAIPDVKRHWNNHLLIQSRTRVILLHTKVRFFLRYERVEPFKACF